jgi:uncharacterized protein YjbI with pentapeptide repeats
LLMSDRVNERDMVIDLSHEAIIQRWQRLAEWRAQDRDLRRLVNRIEDAHRDWLRQGKKRQDLLPGRLLKNARQLLKQQGEAIVGTKAFVQQSLLWQRTQLAATLLVPVLVLGIPFEYFWREEAVKRDYARIENSVGDEGERASTISLAGGCWAQKTYAQIPEYFRERFFGNCRSLDWAKLDKAILYNVNLSGVSLYSANLSGAKLSNTDLSGAKLKDANLSGVHLFRGNLSRAEIQEANLSNAIFYNVNLSNAYLSSANLSNAMLINSNLSGAYLSSTNLGGVHLDGANLGGVHLDGANLKNVRVGCFKDFFTRKSECTNLENVEWNRNTQWRGIKGWDKAKNIPPALKQQLGLR